jgi:hypothetical protein
MRCIKGAFSPSTCSTLPKLNTSIFLREHHHTCVTYSLDLHTSAHTKHQTPNNTQQTHLQPTHHIYLQQPCLPPLANGSPATAPLRRLSTRPRHALAWTASRMASEKRTSLLLNRSITTSTSRSVRRRAPLAVPIPRGGPAPRRPGRRLLRLMLPWLWCRTSNDARSSR